MPIYHIWQWGQINESTFHKKVKERKMDDIRRLFGIGKPAGNTFSELFGPDFFKCECENPESPLLRMLGGESGASTRASLLKMADNLKDPNVMIKDIELKAKELEITDLKKAVFDSFRMIKDLRAEITNLDKKVEELAFTDASQETELFGLRNKADKLEKINAFQSKSINNSQKANRSKRRKIDSLMEIINSIATIQTDASRLDLKRAIEVIQYHIKELSEPSVKKNEPKTGTYAENQAK